MLEFQKREKTEVWKYRFKGADISIVFMDEEFVHCSYDMSCPYPREGWRLLKAIEEKIQSIENRYKNNNCY